MLCAIIIVRFSNSPISHFGIRIIVIAIFFSAPVYHPLPCVPTPFDCLSANNIVPLSIRLNFFTICFDFRCVDSNSSL